MTRGSIIWGKDELTRAPAPDAKHIRRDTFQLGARSAPLTRSHRLGARNDDASIRASMQSGSNTSPGLSASVIAGSHGEERPCNSFPRRPFLVQFAIDVAAVLIAFTLILATGFGLGFAVFALLFLSF